MATRAKNDSSLARRTARALREHASSIRLLLDGLEARRRALLLLIDCLEDEARGSASPYSQLRQAQAKATRLLAHAVTSEARTLRAERDRVEAQVKVANTRSRARPGTRARRTRA